MAKQFVAGVEGLNSLLRDFNKLGKVANAEMKDASRVIAERHMVPAYKREARKVPHWGEDLAGSVRSRNDRIPSVSIGFAKRAYSGGASTNMVRYPTDTGRGKGSKDLTGVNPFTVNDWLGDASASYQRPALQEWTRAVDRIIRKWITV